jgi:hypothetical protein
MMLCSSFSDSNTRGVTRTLPVRQPRHPTVRVRPLELWQVGLPDSSVVHRIVIVHCPVRLLAPALTSARAVALFTVHCRLLQTTVGAVSRCSAGTPDSPVLHRTVRWIIAEWLPKFPKLSSSERISLVHRTLSGGTPDSPVRQTRAASVVFCSFYLNPFLDFLLVCVETLAPVELII